jgi:alkanesulfonate monooxygenase SsuD/methylene tetrahydromethanopterin reductase-like flavin-dependent oxidoreductase (luciferase family)
MDHPYQPAFLDTWTLLSYVAARTERVRLSGYVLNLPSRPPAVLARAAVDLDLAAQHRVLVPEHQQFSILRPVAAK